MKEKHHMIISVDSEKNMWQNSALFHKKNTQQIRNRGNIPQYKKSNI